MLFRSATHEQQIRLTEQFLRASANGDIQGLISLLAEDVIFIGDGGGKARVALKPVRGANKVARGTMGGLRFFVGVQTRVVEVNGQPAVVGYLNGQPCGALLCEVDGEQIRHIYMMANPDKLRGLQTNYHYSLL